MSAAQYRELMDKTGTKSKYRNQKAKVDEIVFDSIAESVRYVELKQLAQVGEIKGFSRQPSFLLPGGVRYRPDFLVCGKEGDR